MPGVVTAPSATQVKKLPPLFFLGSLLIVFGLAVYFFGIAFSMFRLIFQLGEPFHTWNMTILWYSGLPTTLGLCLAGLDLALLLPAKRRESRRKVLAPVLDRHVVVALTAYNDETSIGLAVADFVSHPLVTRVIVVDNNSRDRTSEAAAEAGARIVVEKEPGYGRCVYRCLKEALSEDGELIVLCEGDMTFRAADIDKLLAYVDHADVVNGTRIVEQLRDYSTQLSTFMYYGNFFVGKLLELKHLGRGTFTDIGTTYKLLRRDSLVRLMPQLNPAVNMEFNAHFLDTALGSGERLVECPITFHPRVGVSKGGNVNNARALKVGLRMILGLCFGWPTSHDPRNIL
ncbi:Glycosyl transferase, family 2 [Nitrospira japonica]|uniref:Glycosyl transferase, family 2 n=1 Tax=Nitrospira japonica TaxID=1325564 RepID=A0A1W1I554_9BACT|nr:glycosyltransferase family 2 protein [Nitrospira japonica]SLM48115.1 Glycosyl transferase, family 2 [Nitrospira japonica]